jgi:hypothetical protein
MLEGTSSIGGYCGNTLRRYNDFVNLSEGKPRDRSRLNTSIRQLPPHADFLAVAYRVVPAGRVPEGMEVLTTEKRRALIRDPAALARAFLAVSPRHFDDGEAALQYVLSGESELLTSPAIESAESLSASPPLSDDDRIEFVDFGPNCVVLEVHSLAPRILVLNEMFCKNWTATIDDKDTPIFPANYLFRGVVVPAGASTVVFEYRSTAFTIGLWVTIASGVLLLAVVLMCRPTRRPGPNDDRSRPVPIRSQRQID